MVQVLFLLALAASFAGYAAYLTGLKRDLVEPNLADLVGSDRGRGVDLCRSEP
jgi:hypothetical protein